ncbi:MAG: hypothetical protein D6B25_20680 [Desulfobulbaceae bacterium]|nr:MAG: hypothetical protein D6B25_20680 [Desulfobulbaceae bacterium]
MNGNVPGRQNWTRSLTVLLLIAAVATIAGYLMHVEADAKGRFYLTSSAGSVLFDHTEHSQILDSCAQCHHEQYSAEFIFGCIDCHDDDLSPETFAHEELITLHDRSCDKCHPSNAEQTSPSSCRQCHPAVQAEEKQSPVCLECHDEDYTPGMVSHDELVEIEAHQCGDCHASRSISEAYHSNCIPCHLKSAPQKFAQEDGTIVCGTCHLR